MDLTHSINKCSLLYLTSYLVQMLKVPSYSQRFGSQLQQLCRRQRLTVRCPSSPSLTKLFNRQLTSSSLKSGWRGIWRDTFPRLQLPPGNRTLVWTSQSLSPRPSGLCITMLQKHNFIKVSLCLGASPPACHRWLKVQTFLSLTLLFSSSDSLCFFLFISPFPSGQAERLLNNMQAPWDLPPSLLLSRWTRGLTFSLIAVSSGIWVAIKTQEENVRSAWIRQLSLS